MRAETPPPAQAPSPGPAAGPPGIELLSFGCRLNALEAEAMRGLAAAAGLPRAILVNTCAVTAEAEAQARQAIRRAARDNPGTPILVTGCAAQLAPAAWEALPGVARVIGNAEKLDPAAFADLGTPRPVPDVMAARGVPAMPVAHLAGRARAFVQVQQGCDHRCSFCIIPFGRGPSRSVPAEAVVAQVRALVAQGYREVVLTGVDIASHGVDIGGAAALGALVRQVLAEVPELPRLRLSSLDPAAMDEALWQALAEEPRLMPQLHLSLQHGAGLILKRMKRRHSRAQAEAACARARRLRPDVALGADLIAGFPTETEAQHADSLSLIEACNLAFLHVFPYSARAGTPAARMPQLPMPVRRARAADLRAAGRAAARRLYGSRLGQLEQVLVEAGGRGHTQHFCPVRLRGAVPAPGQLAPVRILAADDDGLIGEVRPWP